jgi:hypothetical protein
VRCDFETMLIPRRKDNDPKVYLPYGKGMEQMRTACQCRQLIIRPSRWNHLLRVENQ